MSYAFPYRKPGGMPASVYGGIITPGTRSTGVIEILDEGEADPNQTITIPSALGSVTYELLDGGLPTPGMVPVDISGAANPAAAAALLEAAIIANQPSLAPIRAGAEITLTYDMDGPSPPIVYDGPALLLSVAGFSNGSFAERFALIPIRWGLSRGALPGPAIRHID